MAARAAFDTAVDFLERVFVRANKTAYGRSLTRWIDPDTTVKEYVAVRDSVISDVLQEGPVYKEGLAAKRDNQRSAATGPASAVSSSLTGLTAAGTSARLVVCSPSNSGTLRNISGRSGKMNEKR